MGCGVREAGACLEYGYTCTVAAYYQTELSASSHAGKHCCGKEEAGIRGCGRNPIMQQVVCSGAMILSNRHFQGKQPHGLPAYHSSSYHLISSQKVATLPRNARFIVKATCVWRFSIR